MFCAIYFRLPFNMFIVKHLFNWENGLPDQTKSQFLLTFDLITFIGIPSNNHESIDKRILNTCNGGGPTRKSSNGNLDTYREF